MLEEVIVDRGPQYEQLKELAVGLRVEGHLLHSIGDPTSSSPFAEANALYRWEKASDWCYEYLSAAIESGLMWADFSAPLEFHESARVRLRPRPIQGLARSALESASQAIWVMTADSPEELAIRHLRLMYADFEEQRKAYKLQGNRVEQAKRQIDRFLSRVGPELQEADVKRRVTYLDTIRGASTEMGMNPDAVEYLWRLASGSTHGKRWAALDLNEVELREEYEPGQHRVMRTPKFEPLLKVLATAYEAIRFGVAVFAARSSADIGPLRRAALLAVAREMPVPAERERERQELIERLSQDSVEARPASE
ncbi:hypothetical protein ACI8AV_13705 [Geodermatophilus sp. SYSU D00804]